MLFILLMYLNLWNTTILMRLTFYGKILTIYKSFSLDVESTRSAYVVHSITSPVKKSLY